MEIAFFCVNLHIGDFLLFKSFIKKFCNVNYDKNIKLLVVNNDYKVSNKFLFNDIPNLEIINDNNYNFNIWYPLNIINNIIYVNIWIPNINALWDLNIAELYCDLFKFTNYYNNLINYINNNYNTSYNLIPDNYKELPTIPYTNINDFLEFKKNKKIIFYYNVYPKSGQPIPINNHNIIIEKLADYYQDYFIVCSNKTNVNKINVLNTEDVFNSKHTDDCENVAKNIYHALNSDYIILYDVGVCLYILNDNVKNFKGKIIHINNDNRFYKGVQTALNIDNYINLFVKDEEELLNDKIQKIMDF